MNTIPACALTAGQGVRYVYNVSKTTDKLYTSTLQTAGTSYHSGHI